ncbi:hypothetical protein [Nocardioides lijunqiniae]|uniref:hypothetical protein n=1 Tax=Nocardioides lijunqiniae TaxID=2760832 RepID=UPI001878349E|nr:hypothetical protein [Nocardioides lijunqiniae]
MPHAAPDDLLLPAGGRLIHIGPHKTGTTAIQVAMSSARDDMAAHGAYYPKGPFRRRKAGWALGLPGKPPGREFPIRHWEQLVAEVREAGAARVCVSDENFARAKPDVVARIVDDLGGEEPRVVAVARRLDRLLPSLWQERVKWGKLEDFEPWLERVLGDDPDDRQHRDLWQGHDFVGLVDRWTQVVDPERFTLVIGDESDRDQLFRVFSQMLGLPPGVLKPDLTRSNHSLSWSESEVIRSLRDLYEDNGWSAPYAAANIHHVVDALRASGVRPTGPRTPPIPTWALDRMREISDQRVAAVASLPVPVIGDAESLRQTDEPVEQVRVEDLSLPLGLVTAVVEGALRGERSFDPPTPAPPAPVPEPREPSGREWLRIGARKVRRRLSRS